MTLCGGDGLADVVGKRVGGIKIPWSQKKTLIGSLSMFVGAFFSSIFILWIFLAQGYFPRSISEYILPVGLITFAATLVESLPVEDIDNLTVPLTAVIFGTILF